MINHFTREFSPQIDDEKLRLLLHRDKCSKKIEIIATNTGIRKNVEKLNRSSNNDNSNTSIRSNNNSNNNSNSHSSSSSSNISSSSNSSKATKDIHIETVRGPVDTAVAAVTVAAVAAVATAVAVAIFLDTLRKLVGLTVTLFRTTIYESHYTNETGQFDVSDRA
ncbi:hypothetical protein V1478_006055 [Vespula squamosa]|uniref:Uncharacterized protein n=1 Tax=Vespula squamosa TaxID=30214 RepID=A0ABD2B952_VESSQ